MRKIICSVLLFTLIVISLGSPVAVRGQVLEKDSVEKQTDSNKIVQNENIVTDFESLEDEITNAPTDGSLKTIIISQDIIITSSLIINSGKNIKLIPENNGSFKLIYGIDNTTSSIITVNENATLTIGNSNIDTDILTIDGNNKGSGALVSNKGKLIINQAIISNSTGTDESTCGGGVYNENYFEMNGGYIKDNNAYSRSTSNGGGGVYNIGHFTMNGGEITNNSAGDPEDEQSQGTGGGIFSKSGTVILNKGIIRGNKAASGGGVYLYGTDQTEGSYATMTTYDSLITNNKASLQGGGVWLCPTGEIFVSKIDFSSVVNNEVTGEVDYRIGGSDYFIAKNNYGNSIEFPTSSLLNKDFLYYKDNPRYQPGDISIDPDEIDFNNDATFLHVGIDGHDIEKLKEAARVLIEGNSAREGGGIASNGILNFGNTPETTKIDGAKTWDDMDNQDRKRPDKITVNLLADGELIESKEVTTADDWKYEFTNLPRFKDGKEIVYTVEEVAVPGYTTTIDDSDKGNVLITNSYTPETTKIDGAKTWNDMDNQDGKRPDKITVNLLADGKLIESKEVTAVDDWKYEFTNLPRFKDGKEIVYTVTENSVDDYTTEINGTDITNSYTPGKTSVSATKAWDDRDNQDGKRPNSIQVQLLADGEKHGASVELNKGNNWTTTWSDLNQQSNGKEIVYTVEEVAVPGYTTTIDDSDKGNVLITNSYTPETTKIDGAKTWNDMDNQDGKRPDKITVNLLADGKLIESKEVTAADDWKYEFTNLPRFKDGKEIVYTVTENSVDDYTTEINGTDITNSYTPGKTSRTVTKNWEDRDNKEGIRPDSIKVQLYANGKEQGKPVELNEKEEWTYIWKGLEAKDKEGKTIQYSVKEVDIPAGYTATITDENTGNILITNTYSNKKPSKYDKTTNSKSPSIFRKILPKTGESKGILLTIIGLVVILVASMYYFYQKRTK
ncbi:Cna B-type domain-containing protein [Vagococcus carniphilus]|uniref:Cna B-type domain-containing protein n=1 Tax=Vagococcus carniphilus TaxID=218144 RepID=UPI003B5AF207